jgi:hypothetical protein
VNPQRAGWSPRSAPCDAGRRSGASAPARRHPARRRGGHDEQAATTAGEVPVFEVPVAAAATRAARLGHWRRLRALAERTGQDPVVLAGLFDLCWDLASAGDVRQALANDAALPLVLRLSAYAPRRSPLTSAVQLPLSTPAEVSA